MHVRHLFLIPLLGAACATAPVFAETPASAAGAPASATTPSTAKSGAAPRVSPYARYAREHAEAQAAAQPREHRVSPLSTPRAHKPAGAKAKS